MFSRSDMDYLTTIDSYIIYQANAHDVLLHCELTGHDWIVISTYGSSNSNRILHRHSQRDPFHQQKGTFKTLKDALDYIQSHDLWFASKKKANQ